MPISFDSLAVTKKTVLGFFRSKLSEWGLGDKDFFGKTAAVSVLVLYQFIRTARRIDLDAVPTNKTSIDGISEWAGNGVGLPNGAGGYGLKGAQVATGGVVTLTGTSVTYPAGQTFTASDGQTKFVLTNGPFTISGTGSILDAAINATTLGVAGNLDAGQVLTVDSPPMGADLTATLTTGLDGGLDSETTAQGLSRIQDRLRNPPKAITAADLRLDAEGVTGIDRAYVYPRRHGTGTVDIVCTQVGTGQSRRAGAPEVDDAQHIFDNDRNVGAESTTAYPPYAPDGSGHSIRVRIVPTNGNEFDWDSGSVGFTVSAYSAVFLTLNANAANLDTAVNVQGLQPRIQIGNSNAPDLPNIATVIAYNNSTHVCTLSEALAVAPANGDPVHAAGSAVAPIAQAIHDMIGALGPSKISGYADQTDQWDDTIRVAELTRVALGTLDGIDRPYAFDLVSGTQPAIDGASTNVQATDTLTNPPELLYAKYIVVTP